MVELLAGLLLAVGCLTGLLLAACAELFTRSESVEARCDFGATISCSECPPCCEDLATARAVWLSLRVQVFMRASSHCEVCFALSTWFTPPY